MQIKVVGIPKEYESSSIVGCAYVLDGDRIYYLAENKTTAEAAGASYAELKAEN